MWIQGSKHRVHWVKYILLLGILYTAMARDRQTKYMNTVTMCQSWKVNIRRNEHIYTVTGILAYITYFLLLY